MILGSAPIDGAMTSDASLVYVTDAAANEVTANRNGHSPSLTPNPNRQAPRPCALDPSGDLLLVANEDFRRPFCKFVFARRA